VAWLRIQADNGSAWVSASRGSSLAIDAVKRFAIVAASRASPGGKQAIFSIPLL
jgi:hypothetical protein